MRLTCPNTGKNNRQGITRKIKKKKQNKFVKYEGERWKRPHKVSANTGITFVRFAAFKFEHSGLGNNPYIWQSYRTVLKQKSDKHLYKKIL